MLRLLIILCMSFLIVSCNTVDSKDFFYEQDIAISKIVEYRARSPSKSFTVVFCMAIPNTYSYYLKSKAVRLSEGIKIGTCGVCNPFQRVSKNGRSLTYFHKNSCWFLH